MVVVFRDHPKTLCSASMISLAAFVLFYLMTVFALSWGTTALGYTPREVPADAAVRDPVLRADDSDSARCSPSAAAARTLIWVTSRIGAVRPRDGAAVRGGHGRRGHDDGRRAWR